MTDAPGKAARQAGKVDRTPSSEKEMMQSSATTDEQGDPATALQAMLDALQKQHAAQLGMMKTGSKTKPPPKPSPWPFRMAFAFVLALHAVIFAAVNREVPAPYMDEIFHVPQAGRYCDAVIPGLLLAPTDEESAPLPTALSKYLHVPYDPDITTPAGLYAGAAAARTAALVAGAGPTTVLLGGGLRAPPAEAEVQAGDDAVGVDGKPLAKSNAVLVRKLQTAAVAAEADVNRLTGDDSKQEGDAPGKKNWRRISNICPPIFLRGVNALWVGPICFLIAYFCARHCLAAPVTTEQLKATAVGKSGSQGQTAATVASRREMMVVVRALRVHLMPFSFFFYFLFYTEALSTMFLLAMLCAHAQARALDARETAEQAEIEALALLSTAAAAENGKEPPGKHKLKQGRSLVARAASELVASPAAWLDRFAGLAGIASMYVRQNNVIWVFAAALWTGIELLFAEWSSMLRAKARQEAEDAATAGEGKNAVQPKGRTTTKLAAAANFFCGCLAPDTVAQVLQILFWGTSATHTRPQSAPLLPTVLFSRLPVHAVAGAGFAYVVVVLNGGNLAFGHQEYHSPAPHLAMVAYFCVFLNLLAFIPTVDLGALSGKAKSGASNARKIVVALGGCVAALAFVLHCTAHYAIAHPFLLSDNRHISFYLWRRFFGRGPDGFFRLFVAPAFGVVGVVCVAATAGWGSAFRRSCSSRAAAAARGDPDGVLFAMKDLRGSRRDPKEAARAAKGMRSLQTTRTLLLFSVFALCTTAALAATPLLELRYFIVPMTVVLLVRPLSGTSPLRHSIFDLICEVWGLVWAAALNVGVFGLFFFKTFTDEKAWGPGTQRLML